MEAQWVAVFKFFELCEDKVHLCSSHEKAVERIIKDLEESLKEIHNETDLDDCKRQEIRNFFKSRNLAFGSKREKGDTYEFGRVSMNLEEDTFSAVVQLVGVDDTKGIII